MKRIKIDPDRDPREAAKQLAREVISGSIIAQAAERLVLQVVETCSEYSAEQQAELRSENSSLRSLLKEAMQAIHSLTGPDVTSASLVKAARVHAKLAEAVKLERAP